LGKQVKQLIAKIIVKENHYCPTKVGIKKVKKGSSEEPPGLVKFELRHLNNN